MTMGHGSPERKGEHEKFVLNTPTTSPPDQVKVVVTLSGDVISNADINLKLPRPAGGKDLYANTAIREDSPWQLQQVQDILASRFVLRPPLNVTSIFFIPGVGLNKGFENTTCLLGFSSTGSRPSPPT